MLFLFLQESKAFIDWISYPPGSMIFIIFVAITTSLISTGITKWLVDTDEINRKQVIKKAHDEEKAKIIDFAETDPEKYRKMRNRWERLDSMIKQSQSKMALKRILPSCITVITMAVIFSVVRGLFGNANPVALSPMNGNDLLLIGSMMAGWTSESPEWTALVYGVIISIGVSTGWINFTAWYFLCNFGISTLIQRLLKLQTQAQGGWNKLWVEVRLKQWSFRTFNSESCNISIT